MSDAVVIGGGVNGLVAAAKLAKAGRSVVLCERSGFLGGLAAGEEIAPGHVTVGTTPETSQIADEVVAGLSLALEREEHRPDVVFLDDEGERLTLHGDEARATEEIGRHSSSDAERFGAWRAFLAKVGRVLDPLRRAAPPEVLGPGLHGWLEAGRLGASLRRLGKRDMLELVRIAPTCAADWLNEQFETELLKAGLAVPGIAGTWLGPWSAGSTLNLLSHECGARGAVKGGAPALVGALESAAQAAGVELRTEAEVAGVRVDDGRVAGVTLRDGGTVDAPVVVATCDPKRTLLDLVPPRAVTQILEERVLAFRARGTTAVVHLALSGPLGLGPRARTGATLDDLERAFDGVKYGRLPESPTLEVFGDGTTVTVHAHHVPYELEGGWNDERREELGALVVETLARRVPAVRDGIVARVVLSPADLAERFALTGGHLHQGEHALDQLFVRPTPETARYATPIPGLFLGGSGSHPGGGITGLPGWLAAGRVLDRGRRSK